MADVTESDIAAFYDKFGRGLLDDYVYGNIRVAHAVDRVSQYITPNVSRVLDIGCGIGISTAEFFRRFPHIRLTGLDISPENVRVASALFGSERLSFEVSTLTDGAVQGSFDVVAMIDVYEHFPSTSRSEVHERLRDLLSDEGVLIVTVPSPLHQAYLRNHNPAGLQIVDEFVTVDDAVRLARDVDGSLTVFEYVSIWRTYDYIHIVVQRKPKLAPLALGRPSRLRRLQSWTTELCGRVQRRNHVRRALGIKLPLRRAAARTLRSICQ